eukprot:6190680-Pleurochrysis_carterae.AAC.1
MRRSITHAPGIKAVLLFSCKAAALKHAPYFVLARKLGVSSDFLKWASRRFGDSNFTLRCRILSASPADTSCRFLAAPFGDQLPLDVMPSIATPYPLPFA